MKRLTNACYLLCMNFAKKSAPDYMNEIFFDTECNGIPTRSSYQKLKYSCRKTKQGLIAVVP